MSELTKKLDGAIADRYVIERELGAGGMATVYLAHDVKHERKVALKVLRPELAAVIGAERFLAEIKVTANLQHPHILPLHDSGEAESFLYYVMPYVEGQTLRDKLDHEKQLGIEEAVALAKDVASALDYAHRQGVIHRDIKPENVLIHDGQPLIADFGIALALSHAGGNRLTETGLSIGTPHYMSPEQAMGDRELDARSDVYSLGAMLYEMLTGDPPYTGSTAQAIVAKVITEKAPPVTATRETVPVHVAAAIAKALSKLPADRFSSASAFAAALSTPGFGSTEVADAAATRGARPARKPMTIALVAALVLMSVMAGAGWFSALRKPAAPVQRFELAVAPEFAIPPAFGSPLAISPDGQQYVFVGPGSQGRQLWLRSMDRLDPVPLGGTDGAMSPRFSPDGRWIAFTAEQRLRKVPVTGGSPITLADSANGTLPGAAWLDDGTLLFTHGSWGLHRMPAAGGDAEPVVRIDSAAGGGFFFPDGLPGSKRALVTMCTASCAKMDIGVVDLADGAMRVLVEDAARAWYLPTGHLAYADRMGSVFAAPFDAGNATITGPAVPVAEGVGMQVRIVPEMEISRSGSLLYRPGGGGEIQLTWVDMQGQASDVDPEWAGFFGSPSISPSGDRAAVSLTVGGTQDIWVKTLDRGPASRLSFEGETNERPVWSPDGRRVGYISNRPGTVGPKRAVARRADGGGQDEVLLEHQLGVEQILWSHDGGWLVARVGGSDGVRDIVGQRIGVDTVPRPLVATPADEYAPALSPDDRLLAYVSTESGQPEVFVVPFPNTEDARWQVSVRGGSSPVWAPDGSQLYFMDGARNLVAVSVTGRGAISVGRQQVLFPAPSFDVDAYHPAFAVDPNGKRLLVTNRSGTTGADLNLVLVQHWFEEIRGRFRGER